VGAKRSSRGALPLGPEARLRHKQGDTPGAGQNKQRAPAWAGTLSVFRGSGAMHLAE